MNLNFPDIEKKILEFWQEKKIFEKSISQKKGKPFFSFYDGPPFATGKPHYGHILATTIKDIVLRYWTMKGYQVPRRVGWDCHGLPVENLIEKELGIKNKKEIEKFGIEKFNRACRLSVFRCLKDFEKILKRVGRWADYSDAYATLDNDYIESVWWVFKQLWDRGLIYKDYRVSPYCPRCGTPLSNFEVNQGYRETIDPSIYIKLKVKDQKLKVETKTYNLKPNTYLLVWTTTPWTLPGNVALAVNPGADYLLIKEANKNESYILAKERLNILDAKYQIIKKFRGRDLIGLRYEPLFDSLAKQKIENISNAFQVLPADFVSLDEGTGIVHIAVMYGDDDFQLGKKFNLPTPHTVDESGFFKKEVNQWAGQFVKEADPKIIKNLDGRKLLYKKEEITHTYPFCWRCDTPLLYYALETWYIAVTKFKKKLVLNNKKIHWVPKHIKEGRFGKWLKEAKDWAFSRSRFWGAPVPIWQCQKCGKQICIGSIKELKRLQVTSYKIEDLHRPYIDKITFKCEKCGGKMERIPEVFDCWFESGSMPYGQWHYPFEKKKLVEKTFPADFIAEGLDQTRGWFYTLHVLAAALTLKNTRPHHYVKRCERVGLKKDQPAFKNVIVNGLILDSQGRKLSKKLGNYPEPIEIFDRYGADSLRYFLLASTPIGEDYRFSSERVKEVFQRIISTLGNSYIFFETYRDKNFKPKKNFKPTNLLDKWIISRLHKLNRKIVRWMDQYELTKATRLFEGFIDDLSRWYIRRSRRRFQRPETKKEKEEASQTLYYLLFTLTKLIAPFTPFISEYLYQNLRLRKDPESSHLCDYPRAKQKLINEKLEEKMEKIQEIVTSALAERIKIGIKVRQPLLRLKINPKKFFQNLTGQEDLRLKIDKDLLDLIKEEINVKEIVFDSKIKKDIELDTRITPKLKEEGIIREVIRHIQEMRKKAGLKPKDKIFVEYSCSKRLAEILTKNRDFILKEGKVKDFVFVEKLKEGFDIKKEIKVDGENIFFGIKKLNYASF